MAKATPITRRNALSAAFALSTITGAGGALALDAVMSGARADENHPDAAILAYRPLVMAALGQSVPLRAEMDRLHAEAEEEAGPAPGGWGARHRAWDARLQEIRARNGASAAHDRWSAALDACDPAREALIDIPARTPDGVSFKALVTIVSFCGGSQDDALAESILADLQAIEAARAGA